MIIFGWGRHKDQDLGPVVRMSCKNCNNQEYWRLRKVSTWFTLFFIPIFPYESHKLLVCPICKAGVKLKDQQFSEMLAIAKDNNSFLNGEITKEEYETRSKSHKLDSLNTEKF